jgi:hypothetical protein
MYANGVLFLFRCVYRCEDLKGNISEGFIKSYLRVSRPSAIKLSLPAQIERVWNERVAQLINCDSTISPKQIISVCPTIP